ncbi:MAG: hypothetical protein ACRDT8_26780, partial [Micromonosporaceae bacterium]
MEQSRTDPHSGGYAAPAPDDRHELPSSHDNGGNDSTAEPEPDASGAASSVDDPASAPPDVESPADPAEPTPLPDEPPPAWPPVDEGAATKNGSDTAWFAGGPAVTPARRSPGRRRAGWETPEQTPDADPGASGPSVPDVSTSGPAPSSGGPAVASAPPGPGPAAPSSGGPGVVGSPPYGPAAGASRPPSG